MIIDCKKISEDVIGNLVEKVRILNINNIFPILAVVLVGDIFSSRIYVNSKKKACEKLGIGFQEYAFPDTVTEPELCDFIQKLNCNKNITGILVQLPLPNHIDKNRVCKFIDPKKDVDGFAPENVYNLYENRDGLYACTAQGILEIFKSHKIDLTGKNCVIINRSSIVGKPVAMMMLHENSTVTICHSKTNNLQNLCINADILITGVGKPKFISQNMVKENAIVIDVGISRTEDNKVCGDVDFENVAPKCSYITPVPGGVGLLTVAMLMKNVVKAAKIQHNLQI
ncbi:MAG: bifunctional 5,10-methylenetetrahydrofolate dehydrogenase/5,10-methenyltetrahydrofolate cyclohydrolase [Clostridia bacterium]|nr:bifunctional 5,10-methylenetetrahydrofolate dehydrogenase/5,10-methenyltetrahydrofolate cyclohydrolase [Clostridia bacterium]